MAWQILPCQTPGRQIYYRLNRGEGRYAIFKKIGRSAYQPLHIYVMWRSAYQPLKNKVIFDCFFLLQNREVAWIFTGIITKSLLILERLIARSSNHLDMERADLPSPLLKGGCHNFQYLKHKSSWHWNWWENIYIYIYIYILLKYIQKSF